MTEACPLPLPKESHRESDDDYSRIVAHLNDRWRVIVCKDQIQWILQRRDGQRGGRSRWTGKNYFLTKDALINFCQELCGPCDPVAIAILDDLPDRFPRRS